MRTQQQEPTYKIYPWHHIDGEKTWHIRGPGSPEFVAYESKEQAEREAQLLKLKSSF